MLRPPRLRPGDVVRAVSVSSFVPDLARDRLGEAVAALSALGLRVQVPDQVWARDGWTAGPARQRADALREAWLDPQVAMVLMSQGGQSANHLLDRLDFAELAATPKVFMGMSDGTTLVSALAAAGLVAFHGPDLLWGFGRPMARPVLEQVRQVLIDAAPAGLAPAGFTVHRPGTARGVLLGGHTATLLATLQAGVRLPFEGALLFLEGTHSIAELDRDFTVLRLAGVLDRVAGVVLGHFERPAHDQDPQLPVAGLALRDCPPAVPIVEFAEFGHNVDNVVLPVGAEAVLDTDAGIFRLTGPAVS